MTTNTKYEVLNALIKDSVAFAHLEVDGDKKVVSVHMPKGTTSISPAYQNVKDVLDKEKEVTLEVALSFMGFGATAYETDAESEDDANLVENTGEGMSRSGSSGFPIGDALKKRKADRETNVAKRLKEARMRKAAMTEGVISKIDKAQQNVFGWAYISHDREGNVNVDKSGDFIDTIEELEKSAYDFVLSSRNGDQGHTNVKISTMIESVVFTPEKIEKMGLPAGSVPNGWWIGFHVEDAATWERVEKGELTAFSIHGSGVRSKVSP